MNKSSGPLQRSHTLAANMSTYDPWPPLAADYYEKAKAQKQVLHAKFRTLFSVHCITFRIDVQEQFCPSQKLACVHGNLCTDQSELGGPSTRCHSTAGELA